MFDFEENRNDSTEPLAYRMRPQNLGEFAGQHHLVGPNCPIRQMITDDRLHSFVLYGPPGSGKTSLALILSQATRSHFEYLKAVTAGVADLRSIAKDAEQRLKYYKQRTVLFVDEVHRFNKSQQDVLLPFVESGLLTLIGATTENPLYEINSALLSRLKIYVFEPLSVEDLRSLLLRAVSDPARGLGQYGVSLSGEAADEIILRAKGDARSALNLLETAWSARQGQSSQYELTRQDILDTAGHFFINYDKKDDAHYDTISAFIKSIRGSDPDAALFWLAVMIHGGEDPLFIARRLVIHAAEDIGMADPNALLVATAAFQAAHFVGFPEARIPLAEATIYLSTAPKSNSSVIAIDQAMAYVRNLPSFQVPSNIADSSHRKSHLLGKGVGYKYPHDFGGYVEQNYLPENLPEKPVFYHPSGEGHEAAVRSFMTDIRKRIKPKKHSGQDKTQE